MAHDQQLIRRVVDAVDPVGGHVALDPVHAGPEAAQHAAGLLRDFLEFRRTQLACARNVPFNDELRHVILPNKGHRLTGMLPAAAGRRPIFGTVPRVVQ